VGIRPRWHLRQLERGGLSLKPLSLLAVLLLWQALAALNSSLQFYNPKLFPAPSDIAVAGWTLALKATCSATSSCLSGAWWSALRRRPARHRARSADRQGPLV